MAAKFDSAEFSWGTGNEIYISTDKQVLFQISAYSATIDRDQLQKKYEKSLEGFNGQSGQQEKPQLEDMQVYLKVQDGSFNKAASMRKDSKKIIG